MNAKTIALARSERGMETLREQGKWDQQTLLVALTPEVHWFAQNYPLPCKHLEQVFDPRTLMTMSEFTDSEQTFRDWDQLSVQTSGQEQRFQQMYYIFKNLHDSYLAKLVEMDALLESLKPQKIYACLDLGTRVSERQDLKDFQAICEQVLKLVCQKKRVELCLVS